MAPIQKIFSQISIHHICDPNFFGAGVATGEGFFELVLSFFSGKCCSRSKFAWRGVVFLGEDGLAAPGGSPGGAGGVVGAQTEQQRGDRIRRPITGEKIHPL